MVLGMLAAVVILGLVASFAVGRGNGVPAAGTLPTLPTTTTTKPGPTTTTTIVVLREQGVHKRVALELVTVPNVVGLTLGQANQALGTVGLSAETWTPTAKPTGTSPTGTVLAQSLAPGSQAQPGQVVELTVSGY